MNTPFIDPFKKQNPSEGLVIENAKPKKKRRDRHRNRASFIVNAFYRTRLDAICFDRSYPEVDSVVNSALKRVAQVYYVMRNVDDVIKSARPRPSTPAGRISVGEQRRYYRVDENVARNIDCIFAQWKRGGCTRQGLLEQGIDLLDGIDRLATGF